MSRFDLQLTSEQLAILLHKYYTQTREDQKRYLESLGGNGSSKELDFTLSVARHDSSALAESERLTQQWNAERFPDTRSVDRNVSQAVNFFLHSLMAGDFGPDGSRDGRSSAFLKNPNIVARTTEIFIERLRTNLQGEVINHDEAEAHAIDYLRDYIW
ncbi:hypothetical protein SH139x_002125 [Planctomycetaceae bacterium SH139]